MEHYVNLTLEDVRRALAQPRPGRAAHQRMAVRPAFDPNEFRHSQPPRQGAVLMLLYPKDGRLTFVLTRRTETVLNHKGQVSFPGGAQEEGDDSLAATALREGEEEVGVPLQDAELLGALTSLCIIPSNYDVHPFVAHIPYRPDFRPFAAEVAELLEIPLSDLLDPSRFREEIWPLRGREVAVPFFFLGGHKVWGATSMILNEFGTMMKTS